MYYTAGMEISSLKPANPSEIEFAEEGLQRSYHDLLASRPGTKEEHAAAHAYVDWMTVSLFQRHSPPCDEVCPYRSPDPQSA